MTGQRFFAGAAVFGAAGFGAGDFEVSDVWDLDVSDFGGLHGTGPVADKRGASDNCWTSDATWLLRAPGSESVCNGVGSGFVTARRVASAKSSHAPVFIPGVALAGGRLPGISARSALWYRPSTLMRSTSYRTR